uniref:Uncharacterized AAA domain-containing protein ycf46 n=1 Tax=Antithamnionella ternifolia TaxID=207919 RepID=A0A4D6WMB4_9FLOR|nr:hypothetical protein [Antithamnionella ternifolia]
MNFEQEIILLLSSQSSFVYIVTDEEQRLEYIMENISQKIFKSSIYCWDFISGYTQIPNTQYKAIKNPMQALEVIEKLNSETPKLFLLKDYNNFLNDISIIRKIKNITEWLKTSNSYIIISANLVLIPENLREYINLIDLPLPNTQEIEIELNRLINIKNNKKSQYIELLKIAYKGFSINKIRQSLSQIIISGISFENSIKQIEIEKKRIIQQTDILDFYPSLYNLKDLGGFKYLKLWLKKRQYSFSKKAKNYGLPNPKGILLVGIQGTGKSLSAKAISQEWNLPLLKLDIGKIFAGIVGESEIRIRKAIDISEQCSPCILWIDEIDKAFNKNNYSSDSGTTNRVLGSFLTWLSEKESQVFIVATSNSLSNLPSEIIRKGRFDEIFFLDLPTLEERNEIFKIHLKKIRPLTWKQYNINKLSEITNEFSGAEIEQVIIEAMYNGFYENREFTTLDIIKCINQAIPLAFTDQDNINKLKSWVNSGKVKIA